VQDSVASRRRLQQPPAHEITALKVDSRPGPLLLRRCIHEGATSTSPGELREPGTIPEEAAEALDFSQPVAIMLFGVLHFFTAADDPAAVVRELMSALPPGSYLALSHLARDVAGDALTETFSRLNSQVAESVMLRTREEVAGLLGRLETVEPGVAQLPQWHPDPDAPAPGPLPMWCGVARKTADQF
jgi:hypothetical protein